MAFPASSLEPVSDPFGSANNDSVDGKVSLRTASLNSAFSSTRTQILGEKDIESEHGILRVRNPTPSPEPLDSTVVVKRSQRLQPTAGVSSFGALKLGGDFSYDTESTDEGGDPGPDSFAHSTTLESPTKRASIASNTNDRPASKAASGGKTQQPLRHWMRQLHQRHLHKKRTLIFRHERMPLSISGESEDEAGPGASSACLRHKKSSSWTSSAFVTNMKSATISLASFPTAPRRKSQSSEMLGLEVHSRSSNANGRKSTDRSSEPILRDERGVLTRATLRQHTLFEMMSTEANYIEDLKALVSTYRLIMDLMPAESTVDVHRCILSILELHETLLDRLRELGIGIASQKPLPLRKKLSMRLSNHIREESHHRQSHPRSKSVNDAYFSSSDRARRDRHLTYRAVMAPNDAACVAHVFNSLVSQFFVYEEYAATYATMVAYLSTSTQQISQWQSYEKGLEALVHTMAPLVQENQQTNRPVAYGDLLIKPIQRICRYPLLFAELLKHTPATDDPESHKVIEKALYRLRETAEEINKATSDEYTREKIERSWKLQDMLVFSRGTAAPFPLRSLGRVELCGALYVAYQASTTVTGDYMLCTLFNSYLLLAIPNWGPGCIRSFTVVACISLIEVKLEAADTSKGLKCNNAPFTWKIVFEIEQRIFEIIVCACSVEEEQQWKRQILRMAKKLHDNKYLEEAPHGPEHLTLLAMDIEPIGYAILARRLSLQRTFENNGMLKMRQVIIKNTHSQSERIEERPPTPAIKRSQSLLSGSCHTTILCPRRSTRICIEQEMHKVWSTEFLPYPGLAQPREKSIRRSASHVIRKFSKNSLTGSIGKRSFTESSIRRSEDCTSRAEVSSSQLKQPADGMNRYAGNLADITNQPNPRVPLQLGSSDRPRVRFAKDVLRKLPQRKSAAGRKVSPQSSAPSSPSPPKPLSRVSSVSFEKLGALFKLGS